MELKSALRLSGHPSLAFVGAGGKTTAMFTLARELAPPVMVTASAHLAIEQIQLADHHHFIKTSDDVNRLQDFLCSGVNLCTGLFEGERTTGLSSEVLDRLYSFCLDRALPLLIEADGSRRLPLKAPADHEPSIPDFVKTVVVVAGLSGIGKPLTPEWVHRPERFASLSGLSLGETITPQALARVLTHPNGGLKGIPAGARPVVLFNQADTPELRQIAQTLVHLVQPMYPAALMASFNAKSDQGPVFSVHEPVAAVILAAGEARRFGQPKQMLLWEGKPMVWHAARKATEAELSPVVVVSGAYTNVLRPVLADLPVSLVHHPGWQAGQGTSVGAGMQALPPETGGVIFLLADQPRIPVALLRTLVATHAQTRSPIVAPKVRGQPANPVLFDRSTFDDLAALSGQAGGRQLFSSYPVTWVDWDDPAVFLDIDTPSDYKRLIEL